MPKVADKFITSNAMLDWQYMQILAELGEIQRHASDPTCPCRLSKNLGEHCLAKHSLGLATLGWETAAMDSAHSGALRDLAIEANEKHHGMREFLCDIKDEPEFVEWSRQWRKKIERMYYRNMCNIKSKQEAVSHLHQEAPISEKLYVEIEALRNDLDTSPARGLIKYVRRKGAYKGEIVNLTVNQYREITGQAPRASIMKDGKVPWELALDSIATELGFESDEALKKEVERLVRINERIDELKHQLGIEKGREFSCSPAFSTVTECTDEGLSGEECKLIVSQCGDREVSALQVKPHWEIHDIRIGEELTDKNKIEETHYLSDARAAIKDISDYHLRHGDRSKLNQSPESNQVEVTCMMAEMKSVKHRESHANAQGEDEYGNYKHIVWGDMWPGNAVDRSNLIAAAPVLLGAADYVRGWLESGLKFMGPQGEETAKYPIMQLDFAIKMAKHGEAGVKEFRQENQDAADLYKNDPLMKTIHMQICPCIFGLLSDKTNTQKLPICKGEQKAQREECIFQMKAANKDNGCKPEGDGSARCPSPFAVCTTSVGCRTGRKAERGAS